jgi:hypothetical protein
MTESMDSRLADENIERLKLGSLWIPVMEGLDVAADLDKSNGRLTSVSLTYCDSIASLHLFAAAKDTDTWSEIRYEIAARLEETKVQPKIVNGKFGAEVHAVMPTYDQSGNVTIQAVRFLGINGDRWFMRISISGLATFDEEASNSLDTLLSLLVVERGEVALAPGEKLPLDFPKDNDNFEIKSVQTIHIEI